MGRFQRKDETARVSGYPFWIIINPIRGSVWQGARDSYMFLTEAAAIAEYNFQKAAMRPGAKTGYKIERVDAPGSVVSRRESSKGAQIASLEAAARAQAPQDELDIFTAPAL